MGIATTPTVRFRVLGSADFFSYDQDRFSDLFELDDAEAVHTGLGANVLGLSAEMQWSPMAGSLLRPTIGGGLAYLQRNVGELVLSPAWVQCSGSFQVTPDPDCAQLREDIAIDGNALALHASAGLQMILRSQAITLELRYAHGLGGPDVRFLAFQLGFRSDF